LIKPALIERTTTAPPTAGSPNGGANVDWPVIR
jgi:hypothetical protein